MTFNFMVLKGKYLISIKLDLTIKHIIPHIDLELSVVDMEHLAFR